MGCTAICKATGGSHSYIPAYNLATQSNETKVRLLTNMQGYRWVMQLNARISVRYRVTRKVIGRSHSLCKTIGELHSHMLSYR